MQLVFKTLIKTTNGGSNWIKKDSGIIEDRRYTCVFLTNEKKVGSEILDLDRE